MKVAAVILLLLALIVGVVPQFTDCQSQGKAIEMPNGKTVAMKCHWTARAELAVALPLLVCAILLWFSRRQELWAPQGAMGAVLGLGTVLLPTVLIGVCAKPDMVCHALMKPVLTLAGSLAMVVGAVVYLRAKRTKE